MTLPLTLHPWHPDLTAVDLTRKCCAFPSECHEALTARAKSCHLRLQRSTRNMLYHMAVMCWNTGTKGNTRSHIMPEGKSTHLWWNGDRIMGWSCAWISSTSLQLQLGQTPEQRGTQSTDTMKKTDITDSRVWLFIILGYSSLQVQVFCFLNTGREKVMSKEVTLIWQFTHPCLSRFMLLSRYVLQYTSVHVGRVSELMLWIVACTVLHRSSDDFSL